MVKSMEFKKDYIIYILLAVIIVIGAVYISGTVFSLFDPQSSATGTLHNSTIVVKEKFIKSNPETGEDQYLIADTNNHVYKDIDNKNFNKTNSTDIYVQAEVGGTYNITTVGIRNSTLSEYPNIISLTKIS